VQRLARKLGRDVVGLAGVRIWIPPYPNPKPGGDPTVDGHWRAVRSLDELDANERRAFERGGRTEGSERPKAHAETPDEIDAVRWAKGNPVQRDPDRPRLSYKEEYPGLFDKLADIDDDRDGVPWDVIKEYATEYQLDRYELVRQMQADRIKVREDVPGRRSRQDREGY
jgi:hypothetical protein